MEHEFKNLPVEAPLHRVLFGADDRFHAEQPHEGIEQPGKEYLGEFNSSFSEFNQLEAVVKQQIIELVEMNQVNIRCSARFAGIMNRPNPAAQKTGKEKTNP